jgi:hypothetical protein
MLDIAVYATDSDVRVFQHAAQTRVARGGLAVLAAKDATEALGVHGGDPKTPSTEHVEFSFTDARQVRWRRRGNGPPERLPGRRFRVYF